MFCGKTLLTSDDKTKMKSNKKTTDASTIIPRADIMHDDKSTSENFL